MRFAGMERREVGLGAHTSHDPSEAERPEDRSDLAEIQLQLPSVAWV